MKNKNLVIFGASNILSDIFDCALANQLEISKIVLHLPEEVGMSDRTIKDRVADLKAFGANPQIIHLDEFQISENEIYILGPTSPSRFVLADLLTHKFQLKFTQLVHPTAYVSPLSSLSEGVFIGANSVIGPGVQLAEHVFINRAVTIGHDTKIGSFSRVQPGANLGGLSKIGKRVTIGIGATLIERLSIGDDATVAAGAVVTKNVDANVLVVGIPAKFKKKLG